MEIFDSLCENAFIEYKSGLDAWSYMSKELKYRYKQVSSVDVESEQESPEGLRSKQIDDWVVFLDYLWAKGRQIFWICLSVYFLWNSNIFNVALECNSIHGSFFNSVLFSGIVLLLMITFGTIGPIYFDLPNIEEKFPWIMPITAISCLYFFFCGIALMWPLFSVWIIPIFVSFFLGFVNIGNILPNHKISTFIMFGCLLCSILSFKIIPHSGFLHDLNSCYA